jgi:integrase/recombinase XerD
MSASCVVRSPDWGFFLSTVGSVIIDLTLSADLTDDELVEAWLRGRPETTTATYRASMVRLRQGVAKPLGYVVTADLIRWYGTLPGSDNTRARHIAAAKSFFSFAFRSGARPSDPGVAIKLRQRQVRRPERVLSRDTIGELLARSPRGRDRTLLEFLYATGARPSEVTAMTFGDLRGSVVTLHGKGGRVRRVPISDVLKTALLALRPLNSSDATRVFRSYRGRPLCRRAIALVVSRTADDAGVERVCAYSMRHSFATHMIEDGVPVHVVQGLLGHATLHCTSVYVHRSADEEPPLP